MSGPAARNRAPAWVRDPSCYNWLMSRAFVGEPRRGRLRCKPEPDPVLPTVRSAKRLAVGAALVAASAALGASVSHGARADWVDQVALRWLPADGASTGYVWLTRIGSPPVLLGGLVAAVAMAAILKGSRRAAASVAGPIVAVLISDLIAKPIIDRQLVSGHFAYPSGTEVAVAAVAMALVLAAPARGRWYASTVAVAACVGVGVGVVGLRWHYPTDVIGGMLLGSGCVLIVDAVFHLVGPRHWHSGVLGVEGPDPRLTAAAK